jgi:D-galactarolactone cycloisomerase
MLSEYARENGIRLIPHGWNTAIGLAADLQLAAALVPTNLGEYLTGSPFIDELVVDGWQLDAQGMLAIPMKPGLGIQINFDALEEYTGKSFDPKTVALRTGDQ